MNMDTTKAGAIQPEHGSRPRKPFESTYGYPNHEDGIQSGKVPPGNSGDASGPNEVDPSKSGPGSAQGNGMKGQK